MYGHCTSHSLHWKQASKIASVSAASTRRTSSSRWSTMPNSIGNESQYLKHMRQPWQISKARVTSPASAVSSQYFGSDGS